MSGGFHFVISSSIDPKQRETMAHHLLQEHYARVHHGLPLIPRPRPRRLSLPSHDIPESQEIQNPNPQRQSRLFRLPYELRILIYEALLGYRCIDLILNEEFAESQNEKQAIGLRWRQNDTDIYPSTRSWLLTCRMA